MLILKQIIIGFVIGVANLIPGVSGGTFALILGVYERLIKCINSFNGETIKTGIALKLTLIRGGFKRDDFRAFISWLKENDYPFLMFIMAGAALSILALSKLMTYLIINQFEYTYAYFFGLIILSIVIPYKLIRSKGMPQIIALIIGVALTIAVAAMVNPAEKVVKKSDLRQVQYVEMQSEGTLTKSEESGESNSFLQFTHKFGVSDYVYIFFCGAIAISAMVLPGVSGSLVLILMGQYFAVVSAIAGLQSALLIDKILMVDELLFLSIMGMGLIVGLLGFSRLIEFVLAKYHDTTISFLVGLIAGSLYPLWPFKKFIVLDNYVKSGGTIEVLKDFKAYTNINTTPDSSTTLIISLVFVALGMVTMVFFIKNEKAEES